MAKQNPATDPVSAAMSAIESALNLTDDETTDSVVTDSATIAPKAEPAKSKQPAPILKPTAQPAEAAPLLRPAPLGEAEPKPTIDATPPANDDRETVGAILQALNAPRDSRTPFAIAIVGALVWLAVCALYAYQHVWPEVATTPLAQNSRPSRDAAVPSRGARADLLHFRLRGARPPDARAAPLGAGDLRGRGAPRRAGDRGGRARRDPVAGDPAGAHLDGRRRRARPRPGGGARDAGEGRGLDARALLFRQRAQDPLAHRRDGRSARSDRGERVAGARRDRQRPRRHIGRARHRRRTPEREAERSRPAARRRPRLDLGGDRDLDGSHGIGRRGADRGGGRAARRLDRRGRRQPRRPSQRDRPAHGGRHRRAGRRHRRPGQGGGGYPGRRNGRSQQRSGRADQRVPDRDRRRDRRARRPNGRADRRNVGAGPQRGRRLRRRVRGPHRGEQRARDGGDPEPRGHDGGQAGRRRGKRRDGARTLAPASWSTACARVGRRSSKPFGPTAAE